MRNKALFLLLVMLVVVACPVFCLTLDDYEAYSENEFPKWSLDLRRAECIFFGGIPIAFPIVGLSYGLLGRQNASFVETLGVACSVSAVIALVDYIIGVIGEN